jgi:hypothetical protein
MKKVRARVAKKIQKVRSSKKVGAWKSFWRKYFSF